MSVVVDNFPISDRSTAKIESKKASFPNGPKEKRFEHFLFVYRSVLNYRTDMKIKESIKEMSLTSVKG